MQNLVLLLATAALLSQSHPSCASNINRQFKVLPQDNEIFTSENSVAVGGKASSTKRILSLFKFASVKKILPKPVWNEEDNTIEITCEAVGSPAPSIQWFRNYEPISNYDFDSNEIIKSPNTSMGEIVGQLIVTAPSPNTMDVYTCLITAGRHTDVYSTTIDDILSSSILTERSKISPLAPKIVVSYRTYADIFGNTVILPCRVKGHPPPSVVWYNNSGVKIKDHDRMEILKTGALSISNISWLDMGEYTCEASNAFGKTSKSTFIYPVKYLHVYFGQVVQNDELRRVCTKRLTER